MTRRYQRKRDRFKVNLQRRQGCSAGFDGADAHWKSVCSVELIRL